MAYYNPFRTGKSPRYPKKRGLFHCSCGPFRPLNWGHGGICSLPVHDVCGNISRGIYLHLDDFYGTCRCIYLTWILWAMGFQTAWSIPQISRHKTATFTLPHWEAPAKHHTIQQHDTSNAPIKTEVHFLKKNQDNQHIKTTPSPASRSYNPNSGFQFFQGWSTNQTSKTPVFPGNPKKRLENLGFFQPPPKKFRTITFHPLPDHHPIFHLPFKVEI